MSAGLCQSHTIAHNPANSHLHRKSCQSKSSRTIMTVRPGLSQAASSINIRLLLSPISITRITGLLLCKIVLIAIYCTPQNSACFLYMAFNCAVGLIALRLCHLIHLAFLVGFMGMACFWALKSGKKPRKTCHLMFNF